VSELGTMLHALVQYNLGLALAAIAIALPIACVVAMGRLSPLWIVHAGTMVYVNVLRSSPLLMVIFWFYAVVPFITGRPASPYFAALTAIAAFEFAYFAEIICSGLQSVSVGQRNAGVEPTKPE
jgi:glutamate/aspartate transport system permease protein